ncbi:MAG: hypothetical protein FJ290_28485 [Planctomycetes bacterium]|nr:hypothetical protein [Planctomycetota bacterium]
MLNAGFAQMVDGMAGWMGLDPAGDDNPQYKYGRWPWEEPRSAPKPPAEKPAATPASKTK